MISHSDTRSILHQILSNLQCLSEEGPFLRLGPLDALQTEVDLLARGGLHVQEEVQQGADQPCGLGLGDGVEEGAHILQQTPQLWKRVKKSGSLR